MGTEGVSERGEIAQAPSPWRVALAGGAGATGGALAYQIVLGPRGMLTWHPVFVVLFVVLLLAAVAFRRFGEERLRRRREKSATAGQSSALRRLGWGLAGVATLLLASAAQEASNRMLLAPGAETTIGLLLSVLPLAAIVTFGWARGAPPAAAIGGLVAGAVAGAAWALALGAFARPLWFSTGFVAMTGLLWGLYGFGGGLGIERLPLPRAGQRAAVGVAAAMVVLFVLGPVLRTPWSLAERLFVAAGWGVGLLLHSQADAVLGVRRAA